MPEYYDCCGSWVWPNDEPEVWEETWEPALWAAAKDFTSSGQCGPLYHRVIVFLFRFLYILNLSTSLSMYLFCNSRIHVITLYSGHVCVYYSSMLQSWHIVWILVRTDHPCLGVGCHSCYQSHTSIIRHWRPYFRKPTMRIRFNTCIRTIVVLIGGKLIGIYFLYLLYAIYFSVMTHLR
jgi:hypothetical protein